MKSYTIVIILIGVVCACGFLVFTAQDFDTESNDADVVTPMGPEQEARISMLKAQHEARGITTGPSYTTGALSAYTSANTTITVNNSNLTVVEFREKYNISDNYSYPVTGDKIKAVD